MLYALEFGSRDVPFLFACFPELVESADPSSRAFELAQEHVVGILDDQTSLDALIQGSSPRWKVQRMSYIDRNILRLAAFELTHRSDDVPAKVVINEAVELAKRFGAEQTRNFVNGILQQICTDNDISLSRR